MDPIVVPERIVRESAEGVGGEENSFTRLLAIGEEYKQAGLEPIYLYDMDSGSMVVVVEETRYKSKLN